MISRHVLTAADLVSMAAAVFDYNRRGKVLGGQFYDPEGRIIQVGYMEAICEDPGLSVRATPEPTAEDRLARLAVGADGLDPRQVPPPASMGELSAATESV